MKRSRKESKKKVEESEPLQPSFMDFLSMGGIQPNLGLDPMVPPGEEDNVGEGGFGNEGDFGKVEEQWVSEVLSCSSEYTPTNWSAKKLIGPPDQYPRYGDCVNCWCSRGYQNTAHHLELRFEKKVYMRGVEIYFNLCPNPVTKIQVRDPEGNWKTVLERQAKQELNTGGTALPPTGGRVLPSATATRTQDVCKFTVQFRSAFKSNEIRIELNTTGFNYWCEIDCVKLLGRKLNDVGDCGFMGKVNKEMLKAAKFSDVEFTLRSGVKIKAHRCVLAIRSKFFNALFENLEGGQCEMDEDAEVFRLFLEYLYGNHCKIPTNRIIQCNVLARKFEQKDFDLYTGLYFQNILKDDNVVELLDQCEKVKCELLVEYCLQYMAENYQSVLQSKDFSKVSKGNILKVCKLLAGMNK